MSERPILIVDDDPSILIVVAELLDDEGYVVGTAVNGADALAAVERLDPGLVLLDMRMPVLDGWGFVRGLRAQDKTSPPILVMTAAQDARRWAEEVGAAGYVAKPFDLDDLLTAVNRLYIGRANGGA